ncbi:hypothetical protein TSUD_206640 [Trifolium subterraneum]|uniref:Ubiquinone biosynthesis protein n=1 Tax=Trifolium subterraneum TaxID=3900 RepID=A0A2Z6NB46_TRISU|nr:hypothetical protein TSUD_206640 [Trifolium subterraneum]
MYRTAAKRLFSSARHYNGNTALRFRRPHALITSSRFSTTESQPFSNPQSINDPIPLSTIENPSFYDSTSSSSSSSSSDEDSKRFESKKSRAKYEDEHARLLSASLTHVMKLGWTEAALVAGARDVDGSLKNLTPSDCISKLIRLRLEMQAPYISTWPQALSIQAQPANVPTSFKQRAMLVDEISHAAGDNASDIDWYAKRTVLGGIYSTTEIYMLTDGSAGFRDTWAFLDARVKDAFDLKKTIQEAQYLAEAVSAGLGNTFQGFVGKVFRR